MSSVGTMHSAHNQARVLFEGFWNQRKNVNYVFSYGQEIIDLKYRQLLIASLKVICFLLGDLPFKDHAKSSSLSNCLIG